MNAAPLGRAFLDYRCGDCKGEIKTFALAFSVVEVERGGEMMKLPQAIEIDCTKIGEDPKPIAQLSPRAKNLIKRHWDLYRKGAESEAIGAGIGAFAYYRRVVEDSRDSIVDEICKAAERLGKPKNEIEEIRQLKESKRFDDSAKAIDHLIPNELRIDGRNPLTVLFGPLSSALHSEGAKHAHPGCCESWIGRRPCT